MDAASSIFLKIVYLLSGEIFPISSAGLKPYARLARRPRFLAHLLFEGRGFFCSPKPRRTNVKRYFKDQVASQIQATLFSNEKKARDLHAHVVSAQAAGCALTQNGYDHAQDEATLDSHFALLNHRTLERQRLQAVQRQLVRGTYGVCEDCEREIPARRLEVCSATTRCVRCQGIHERGRPDINAQQHPEFVPFRNDDELTFSQVFSC